jgi:rod shape-determining protein MreC
MEIEAIPKHASVVEGDTVITSGYSSMFPGGLTVGLVEEVKGIEGSSFYNIKVKLTEDLNKVEYVYVVNNLLQEEQTELEEQVDNE